MNYAPPQSARSWPQWFDPALVTGLVLAVYLAVTLAQNGWNALALAELGDGWQNGQPLGREGYDGQFSYFIALDPRPSAALPHLDVPAYRYQRLLYPLLARALALGQPALIPWALLVVGLAAQVAGTWCVGRWLAARGVSRWYALTYGLWAGLLIAARTDLNEPLCYALVAAALVADQLDRPRLAALLLLLACLTKETALLFLLAAAASAVMQRSPRRALYAAVALGLYALFQLFVRLEFGAWGLGSGGYRGTPFEIIPFMGLWRIGLVSLPALVLFIVIFGPAVVLPGVWGLFASLRRLWQRDFSLPVFALAANAAFLPLTPFSTFREPLGIIRLATGLVLAVLLFGAHTRSRRVLNYALLWMAAGVFIFKG